MLRFLIAFLIPCFLFAKDPALLILGAGAFNICKHPKQGLFQAEFVPSAGVYKTYPFVVRPMVGFMINTNLGNYYYAGARFDLFAAKRFVITPSFAAGLYFKGHSKNLHFPLEFRSCIEASFVQKNKARIGLQFYHLSNASLGKKNPGVEALVLVYAFPL